MADTMTIDARVRIDFDDDLQAWFVAGIHLPAEVPEISGLSSTVWEYREGRLVAGLKQHQMPVQ